MCTLRTKGFVCLFAFALFCLPTVTVAEWVKDPPGRPLPDVEKDLPDLTCWLATAANMLAAAGYGTEPTLQERAEEIYGQLIDKFGRYQ